jgi:hypothetical protein
MIPAGSLPAVMVGTASYRSKGVSLGTTESPLALPRLLGVEWNFDVTLLRQLI